MAKNSKKALNTTTAQVTPIAASEATPKSYVMRLPKETRERTETYIVPKGPLGVERWLAKKSYAVSKDKDGLYVTLTQGQADYYLKSLPQGCAYMPKEATAK